MSCQTKALAYKCNRVLNTTKHSNNGLVPRIFYCVILVLSILVVDNPESPWGDFGMDDKCTVQMICLVQTTSVSHTPH